MNAPLLTSTHWGVYEVETEGGRVTRLKPFAHDPDPSPIGDSMPAALTSPARILRPAIRRSWLEGGPGARTEGRGAEPFVEVPWNEALDLVAQELKRVKSAHGNDAIFAGSYGWSSAGRFHHAQSQVHRFMNAIGGYVRHVTSYSLGAGRTLLPHVLRGIDELRSRHTAWASLEKHCQLFVAFGGVPAKNVQVNSGGVSQHDARPGLRSLARAGVAFVNLSPVRQDLGEVPGAEWIPIRPNTDTAVMLALAHVLVAENLHDREFLAKHCTGFERFRPYLMGETDGVPKSPEWAGPIAGVEPERLRALARRMAANRTFINASWSLQRADHGEQPFWTVVTLAAMLGQVGTPGGGLGIGYGSVNAEGSWATPYSGPVLPQLSNAVKSFIPVARISDMLLNPGARFDYDGKSHVYPDIRLVYWCGGNPFHHHQDLNRLIEAWRRPDTIVVHDHYWTAAAKHADVVLPATTMLERDDIGSSGRDRYMIAMKKAVDAPGEARDDYAIFSDLAERLGARRAYTEDRDVKDWLRHLYEASREKAGLYEIELPAFEDFWRQGWFEAPRPREPQVNLDRFRADPVAFPLGTPSGKIEIYSQRIASFGYDDCPGHPVWQEPAEWLGSPAAARYPLHLISNQPHTKLHSQYDHGAVSLASKIRGREPIAMHPADASARGLAAGEIVRVFNGRGACLAGLRIEEGLRAGVVEMATGAWYDPLEPGRIGTLDKHGNPNVLTLDKGSSKLGQGCIAHSCLVEVERYEGELPPITAFDPPRFVTRGGSAR
ncbi:MAG TPA: molybdopterin-dependent oxidoreductase [Burkholderiales bacterium]|nr:molybdopterin-dependent oxidoreductase [Burkholderiales bacterium]